MSTNSANSPGTRVLVVEDDAAVRRGVADAFAAGGYEVLEAADGPRGLEKALSASPDIVLLDVMLPELDGFGVLARLRQQAPGLPVILLTARGAEEDRVRGLRTGADDYVTKPFSVREVIARVKARLRERSTEPRTPDTFSFGNVKVDLRRRVLWKNETESHLTTHEAGTLAHLITHRGRDVSRDELLQEVWGYTAALTTRTVDNQILKLRKKIEDVPSQPRHILTVHGTGYRFEP